MLVTTGDREPRGDCSVNGAHTRTDSIAGRDSQFDEFSKVGRFDGKISEKVSNMYYSFSEITWPVVRASFFFLFFKFTCF